MRASQETEPFPTCGICGKVCMHCRTSVCAGLPLGDKDDPRGREYGFRPVSSRTRGKRSAQCTCETVPVRVSTEDGASVSAAGISAKGPSRAGSGAVI